MTLNGGTDSLNLVFKFKIDGFDYTGHVSTDDMKCFGCGREGHLIRSCPGRVGGVNQLAVPLDQLICQVLLPPEGGETPERR